MTSSSPPLCAACHKYTSHSKRCSGCKNINYCSKVCQVKRSSCLQYFAHISKQNDWNQHNLLCKSFLKSTSLGSNSRRALFFAPDQSRPRFVWLTYDDDGTPVDIAKCFPDTPRDEVKTIAFHNRFLPYWIQISYDSNMCAQRTLSNTTSIQHAFRGPVVALAYDAEEGLSKPALDVDTGTLGPVLEYAKLRAEYEGPIFVEQPQERYTEDEWKGIVSKTRDGGSSA
jgi:hypothetical protein